MRAEGHLWTYSGGLVSLVGRRACLMIFGYNMRCIYRKITLTWELTQNTSQPHDHERPRCAPRKHTVQATAVLRGLTFPESSLRKAHAAPQPQPGGERARSVVALRATGEGAEEEGP